MSASVNRYLAKSELDDPYRTFATDPAVFEQMYEDLFPKLCRKFSSAMRGDAQDIVQEAFFNAWRYGVGFQGDCRVEAWMTKLCRNELYTHYGRRANKSDIVSLDDPQQTVSRSEVSTMPTPYDVLLARQHTAWINTCVAAMPPEYRTVARHLLCDTQPADVNPANSLRWRVQKTRVKGDLVKRLNRVLLRHRA